MLFSLKIDKTGKKCYNINSNFLKRHKGGVMRNHLDIINDFELKSIETGESSGNSIYVIFYTNGRRYITTTTYANVLPETESRVRAKLKDLVYFNANCMQIGERQRTVSYDMIMNQVERIINEQ